MEKNEYIIYYCNKHFTIIDSDKLNKEGKKFKKKNKKKQKEKKKRKVVMTKKLKIKSNMKLKKMPQILVAFLNMNLKV